MLCNNNDVTFVADLLNSRTIITVLTKVHMHYRAGKVKILHASIWQAISSNIAIHLKTMFLDVNKVDRNIILKKVPLKFFTMKNMLGTF